MNAPDLAGRQELREFRPTRETVLVVIDDALVRDLVAASLRGVGCYPLAVASADEALRLAGEVVPDALVLDVDGGARRLLALDAAAVGCSPGALAAPACRLLLSSAPAGPALEPGWIWLRKPFEPRALVVRLLQALRPSRRAALREHAPLRAGPIEVDRTQPLVRLRLASGWQTVALAPTEHRLLQFLLSEPGRVRSRSEILVAVWGEGAVDRRTVDQYVRRLRRSLEPVGAAALVRTVNRVGYRLQLEMPPGAPH